MKIFFNGEPLEMNDQATLADVIEQQGLSESACATAINGEFIPRASRSQHQLAPLDQIMTFEPITGG